MIGISKLRQAIADKLESSSGRLFDTDNEVTVTAVRPKHYFVLFNQLYMLVTKLSCSTRYAYDLVVSLARGYTTHIPILLPDYRVDWQQLEDRVSAQTRLIIINSPHNPSSSILSQSDLEIG